METYLATAWGDSVDAVSFKDIQNTIAATREMDDEHGAFWVAIVEDHETVLETQKDLTVTGIFPQTGEQIRAQMKTWAEVEGLYALLLDGNFEEVKDALNKSNSH